MKFCVKSEVYGEEILFNKWFVCECASKIKICDMIETLGIEKGKVGHVLVNDYPQKNGYIVNDGDRIVVMGHIYPGYL